MRFLILLAAVLAQGCFQPVDAEARLVASCKGGCPHGPCDEKCSSGVDASCTTADECLNAFGCSKTRSCSSYSPDFQPTCAAATGMYCLTTIGSFGARRTFAVSCTDGGGITTDCTGSGDYCGDAGTYLPQCKAACGSKYCVR